MIPNVPRLYRHRLYGIHYGLKKAGRKRKEHGLGTADRGLAERRLKEWIDDLDRIDAKAAKIMATPQSTCTQKFPLKSGDAVHSKSWSLPLNTGSSMTPL